MLTVEPLEKRHDRSAFASGSAALDDWLRTKANQWTRKGLSRVFVATRDGTDAVLGYYTLSNHHIEFETLPESRRAGLPPRTHVPTVLLGRLAVDRSIQGSGIGRFLLFDAMKRCVRIADEVGVVALEVEADGAAARRFDEHVGLEALLDDPQHLFVPVSAIQELNL